MGAGIAQVAAVAGHRVQLHDARFGAGDAARRSIADVLAKQVARGKLPKADADAAIDRITSVVTLPDACVAAMVVEAIVEDQDAKRELFARLENVVGPECILATNTSSLSITALAAGMKYPGRVVGMHFFNPAPLMPLVEVVSGLATSEAVAATVFATATAWGKTPVQATSTPGFIVNRCARPFYGEALRLLAEGAADPVDARCGDARRGWLPDGAVRAHGSHRARRQLRGDEEHLGGVLQRSALRALGAPAGARRGGLSRPQVRSRLLRLHVRRHAAGAAMRSGRRRYRRESRSTAISALPHRSRTASPARASPSSAHAPIPGFRPARSMWPATLAEPGSR